MLHRLYARTLALSASPLASLWLLLVAFAESSVFPVPPDGLLIPMTLARPDRAWRNAAICTAGSVAGGAFGYLIGFALFDRVALPLLRAYGYDNAFAAFQSLYARYGLWVILVKGLTPIPYKIVAIASGAVRFNFAEFMAASLATRGARFFLEAALLKRYGEPIRRFVERRLTLVASVALAASVAGLLALRTLK